MPTQYGELQSTNGWDLFGSLGHPGKISTGFASCLHYCSDVAHRKPTKLCTMFGRLLGWCTIYTFLGALASWQIFARCKIHFKSKSRILLYWQHYCTTFQQPASAKLCSVVQRMELRNYCRGCHLYSAGRPSRYTSAHILVFVIFSSNDKLCVCMWHVFPVSSSRQHLSNIVRRIRRKIIRTVLCCIV